VSDEALKPPPPKPSALEAARAAMRAEAARPRVSWKSGAVRLIASSLGLAVLVAIFALGSGAADASTLASRWLTLLALSVVGPLLAWSSARPGSPWLRRGAWALAALSAAALVLTRPAQVASLSTTPEWVCTLSHLAVAMPAAVVALWMLRGMAFDLSRAVAAGLAVGTTGALLGELMCGRDATHIALFHLSSWTLAAIAVVALSTRLTRRSFAP
jgi:hypothetical protein